MSSDSHPVESINSMDAALYDAAERGNFEVFENYQVLELESLRTPDRNTVLHVNLASPKVNWALGSSDFDEPQSEFQTVEIRWVPRFIRQILNKCPSLLLEANTKGQTPLHVAARYGAPTVVKFLIQFQGKTAHGDLEQQGTAEDAVRRMLRKTDLESNTALHIAVLYGRPEVVQELLEFEDPDFPYSINRKQESPLYIAARRGDGPLLGMILGKLKSVAHGGPHGRTALHAAAMAGSVEATRKILEKRRKLTKESDEDAHTPLHYAAHLGHSSMVEELLKWDKSAAYATDRNWGMTPLLMAARQGHGQIVTMILSFCPDCCEKVDKIGWNLLHFAAFRNSPSRLSSIFEYGNVALECGSIRNLIDAEDAHGITPQQVYDAFKASCQNCKPNKKMEQILKLLEDIVNEEMAEVPVRPLLEHIGNEAVAEAPVRPIIDPLDVSTHKFVKARDAHLVVAALIATVTFAAAITVPGGYKSEGKEQGTPFLIHVAAFKAFVVTDGLAFIFSLTAVAVYLDTLSPFIPNPPNSSSLRWATTLLSCAIWAMMVAFSTGNKCGRPSENVILMEDDSVLERPGSPVDVDLQPACKKGHNFEESSKVLVQTDSVTAAGRQEQGQDEVETGGEVDVASGDQVGTNQVSPSLRLMQEETREVEAQGGMENVSPRRRLSAKSRDPMADGIRLEKDLRKSGSISSEV
ncbi:hypothetical protein V6N11_038205 [Hibiscus sabdariffa]|uniref:PGG domain-containing protein n=1 Tax=Hibiscus sabdariffa TaxID=183260 RepID=A0ABR2SJ92_9ROSI